MFFSFDGIDGVGKSTQARLLAAWLREQGREVVECRDPGSTAVGEKVRGILLDARSTISLRAEALLYMAARAQMVEEIIRPALYEIRPQATVADLIYLSGGLTPKADAREARLERINERGERFVMNLDLTSADVRAMPLRSGDLLRVLPIRDTLEGAVTVAGHVLRPGAHEWRAGLPDAEPARSRHIADFIAGMTDRYAIRCYEAAVGAVDLPEGF